MGKGNSAVDDVRVVENQGTSTRQEQIAPLIVPFQTGAKAGVGVNALPSAPLRPPLY